MPRPRKSTTNRTKLPTIKQLPSGAYHAKVYDGVDENGKSRYRSFTDYDYNQLLLDLAQFKKDKKDHRIDVATGRSSLTLREATAAYIDSKTAVTSPTTVSGYRLILRNNLQGIMDLQVNELTQEIIQLEINKEALTHAPKTVRNFHGLLTAVLKTYRPDFVLHTRLPQKVKADINIPTEDEIKTLMDHAKDTNMEIPVLLGACCGMRRSEIAALKWDCIDFKANTITIRHALVRGEDKKLVEKTTKTTAGTRTIRMFPVVSETLRRYKETHPEENDGYITPQPAVITNGFVRLVKRAGITHCRFHDLRHYTVSVMLSLNIPKKYIADYVGHETENMIDQVYGHIMASKKTDVEDLLQAYFSSIFA